jgi:hypothetical protein
VNAAKVMPGIAMTSRVDATCLNCVTADAAVMATIATAPAAMMTEAIEARLALKPAIWMRARVAMTIALDWNA